MKLQQQYKVTNRKDAVKAFETKAIMKAKNDKGFYCPEWLYNAIEWN